MWYKCSAVSKSDGSGPDAIVASAATRAKDSFGPVGDRASIEPEVASGTEHV